MPPELLPLYPYSIQNFTLSDLHQVVSTLPLLPVLPSPPAPCSPRGAELRGENLSSRWAGLKARAEDRSEGREVGNRKRRRQARRQEQGGQQGGGQGDKGAKQGVVNITQYVEVGSDCTELVNQHLGEGHSRWEQ